MQREKDARLAERIQERMNQDHRFANYDLVADARNGEVIITGVVDTLSEKNELDRFLKGLPGVREVENAVSISTDGQITDPEVLEEVTEELAKAPDLDVRRVGAKVKRGIVHLVGQTTDPDEINAARRAAAKSRGVRAVVDEVKTSEPEKNEVLKGVFHAQVRNDEDGPRV